MRKRVTAAFAIVGLLAVVASVVLTATIEAAERRTIFVAYVRLPDGVRIAVAVELPGPPTRRYPTLFQMDGYKGGGSTRGSNSVRYDEDRYAMVTASVRGTGCSGGRFDLFDPQTAQDGHHVIERWLVRQRWSDGRVGIVGHSYPGINGLAIAATNPPHVRAIAVSGLMSDVYRDTFFGGVPNQGFPLLWSAGIRPASEVEGNSGRYALSEECAANIATRPAPNPFASELLLGSYPYDYEWYRARSLVRVAPKVRIPLHMTAQYQDEQVGHRAPILWQLVPDAVPKRLILSNGFHSTTLLFGRDQLAWLDCWILHAGRRCPTALVDPSQRVRLFFETSRERAGISLTGADYPLPGTSWTRRYLRTGGALSASPPADGESPGMYVAPAQGRTVMPAASSLQGVDGIPVSEIDGAFAPTTQPGPDSIEYAMAIRETTVVAGPMLADLWIDSSATDTDVDVRIIDRAPDGTDAVLQFGMLRASLRTVDPRKSWRIDAGSLKDEIYRPYHPFTTPVALSPGRPERVLIEIYPVGVILRPGHSLVVRIGVPPSLDQYAQFASGQPPAANRVLHDARHRSSVLLPIVRAAMTVGKRAPRCEDHVGAYCAG